MTQIFNALLAIAIAALGMFTRQKLDIGMVNFHLKLLRVAPFLLGGFMVLNGILTIFYL